MAEYKVVSVEPETGYEAVSTEPEQGYTSSVPEYAKFAGEQAKQALGGALLGVGADVGKLASYAFPGNREQRLKDIEAAAVKKGVELDAPTT